MQEAGGQDAGTDGTRGVLAAEGAEDAEW